MPYVTLDALRVYYEIEGRGPRLLFISGTRGDLRRKPSPFDTPLPAHFETLAYDQRGLGRSDKPAGPYTMAMYGDDAASLLDALGWASCFVVAQSFGGMVAQELAIRHPDKVARLVLCATSPGGAGGSSYPIDELDALAPDERARAHIPIADTRRDAAWQAAHKDEFDRMVGEQVAAHAVGADEPGREEGARLQLEARRHHDAWDRLPSLKMPVLVCGGRYDGQAAPAQVEALAGRIPGAALRFFEGGHAFLRQDPEAFRAILAFLGAGEAAGQAAQ